MMRSIHPLARRNALWRCADEPAISQRYLCRVNIGSQELICYCSHEAPNIETSNTAAMIAPYLIESRFRAHILNTDGLRTFT